MPAGEGAYSRVEAGYRHPIAMGRDWLYPCVFLFCQEFSSRRPMGRDPPADGYSVVARAWRGRVSPRDLAILPVLPGSIATGSRSDTPPSPSSNRSSMRRGCVRQDLHRRRSVPARAHAHDRSDSAPRDADCCVARATSHRHQGHACTGRAQIVGQSRAIDLRSTRAQASARARLVHTVPYRTILYA